MSESTGHEYLRSHQISGDVLLLNLDEESKAVLESARATEAGRTAKTLAKDGPLRLLIVGLKSGASLQEHDAGGPVSIHVLTGEVDVSSAVGTDSLTAGQAIVFASSVTHSLNARADSVVLVTIAWPR